MAKEDLAPKIVIKSVKMIFRDLGYIGLYLLPFAISVPTYIFTYDKISYLRSLADMNKLNFAEIYQFAILALPIYLIIWIISSISASGTIIKAYEEFKGSRLPALSALGEGIRFVPRLIGASIISSVVVSSIVLTPFALLFLGTYTKNYSPIFILVGLSITLFLIMGILAIYLSLKLSLFAPACVLKDLGCIDSLKESWRITKGNLLFVFIVLIFIAIFSIPFAILNYIPIGIPIGSLLSVLIIGPVSSIALTLTFLKLSGEMQEFFIHS